MKNLRRAASAALAALLAGALLAGCAADESGAGPSATPAAQTTGGYVEEDITPDHNYNVGLFVVDGVLNAFTVENPATPLSQQTAHWYAMGQDGSWQEVTLRDGYGVPYEVAGETGEHFVIPLGESLRTAKLVGPAGLEETTSYYATDFYLMKKSDYYAGVDRRAPLE